MRKANRVIVIDGQELEVTLTGEGIEFRSQNGNKRTLLLLWSNALKVASEVKHGFTFASTDGALAHLVGGKRAVDSKSVSMIEGGF